MEVETTMMEVLVDVETDTISVVGRRGRVDVIKPVELCCV